MYPQRASNKKAQVIARWHLYYQQSGLSAKDRSRLNQALRIAENSECRQRHGAVLTQGGRVLGIGVNVNKNDPVYSGENQLAFSIHAEEAAIRAWGGSGLKGATMYVARLGKKGIPLNSRPCAKCQKMLKAAGIRRVVYTIDNEMEI